MPNANFKMLCSLGDSIMKGIVSVDNRQNMADGCMPKQRYRYAILDDGFVDLLQSHLNITVDNLASYGSTITKGLQCLERRKELVKTCDHAFLEYGGNDCDFDWAAVAAHPEAEHQCRTPLALFVERYEELVTTLRSFHVNPIMLSLPPLHPARFFETISQGLNPDPILQFLGGDENRTYRWHERYNIEVFKIARQLDVPIIDITSPFLERNDYGEYLCADGIHPNELGHKLIAETVEDGLCRL